jgi:tetratricopeptide (TPR) repeat protein
VASVVSLFQEVIAAIRESHGRHTRLILMTREHPSDLMLKPKRPLDGLSQSDARLLFAQSKLQLSDGDFTIVYDRTRGNPQFLRTVQYLLASGEHDETARLRSFLEGNPDENIWEYIIRSVYRSLTDAERLSISALSILRSPSSCEQVGKISASWNASLTLRDLSIRFLVEEQQSSLFSLHPLLRDFFYGLLDARTREVLHSRAAIIYAERREFTEAMYHYAQAGKDDEMVHLVAKNYHEVVNTGQAAPASQLLQTVNRRNLSPSDWLTAQTLVGELELLQGRFEAAIRTFHNVESSATAITLQRADAWRHIGNAEGYLGRYDEAIAAFEKGLLVLAVERGISFSLLMIDMGYILYRHRKYAEAKVAIERGLSQLRTDPDHPAEFARGLRNLGDVYYELGAWDEAVNRYNESLAVSSDVDDLHGIGRCYDDLGNLHYHRGEWEMAINHHRKAIEILEKIGDLRGIAIAYSNLGNVEFVAGAWGNALLSHQRSLEVESAIGNVLETV